MVERQLMRRTQATRAGPKRKAVTFTKDRSPSEAGSKESVDAQGDQEGSEQHSDAESAILQDEIHQIRVSDVDSSSGEAGLPIADGYLDDVSDRAMDIPSARGSAISTRSQRLNV